ncbi:MAG: class I SAM-dependent methyltransferase [Gaiella sp.]|nr:class I SAM-dependent methyltransferase [Gaiella sp.]
MGGTESVDLRAVTAMQQKVWADGDFSIIGNLVVLVAENLTEAANVRAGERVLDVACGSGNTAIAAARRTWAPVTGLDFVPALLERGRERAAAEGLEVEYVEGDAQELPFEDGSFDVVLSTFGAMFAPDQRRTADELVRVCRPGGRIGMANWTPDGFVGHLFRTVARHVPPPPGADPPLLWGTDEHLGRLFGDRVSGIDVERRSLVQRFYSPEHWIDVFRTWFGPTKTAFERVGPGGEQALYDDLAALAREHTVEEETLVIPAEYLEVVAVKA